MALPSGRPSPPLFIGVVHLLPLPGGPAPSAGLAAVLERALADAAALWRGGVTGIIVENLGDAPFAADHVDAYTVAAMTIIARELRASAPTGLLGVNVLRNDALAALSIAAAAEADFVRVNVHVGAMVTDQGLITGRARETLMERRRLGADVSIAADVLVKHAVPIGTPDIEQVARDTAGRGLADALIVTGTGTGRPIALDDLRRVRAAVPMTPVWAGSGVDPDTLPELLPIVDAVIVGTWLHEDSAIDRPIDPERVRSIARALRA